MFPFLVFVSNLVNYSLITESNISLFLLSELQSKMFGKKIKYGFFDCDTKFISKPTSKLFAHQKKYF